MIVFLDTEFTDFIRPELLSIGQVTIDEQEFYAELDLDPEVGRAREKTSSDFVCFGSVLDLWRRVPETTVPLNEIGDRLGLWLKDLVNSNPDEPLQVAFDYSTDFELMEIALRDAGVWEDLGSRISRVNVLNRTGSREGQQAAEAHYVASAGDGLGRHHALADARALRASYLTLTAATPVQPKGASTWLHLRSACARFAGERARSSRSLPMPPCRQALSNARRRLPLRTRLLKRSTTTFEPQRAAFRRSGRPRSWTPAVSSVRSRSPVRGPTKRGMPFVGRSGITRIPA